MSVYGNLLKESNEIDYMYSIIMKEASLFDNITASIINGSCIEEGVSFAQIKEGAKKLLKALIEKVEALIKFLKEKVKVFYNKIFERFDKIRGNDKPLKQLLLECKEIVSEGALMESKNGADLEELLNTKTRLNQKIDIVLDNIIATDNYYQCRYPDDITEYEVEKVEKKYSDIYDKLPLLDSDDGYTIREFVDMDFEAKVKELKNFTNKEIPAVVAKSEKLRDQLKKDFINTNNYDSRDISSDEIKNAYDLILYSSKYSKGYTDEEREKERNKVNYITKYTSRLKELQSMLVEYTTEVEKVYEKTKSFVNDIINNRTDYTKEITKQAAANTIRDAKEMAKKKNK